MLVINASGSIKLSAEAELVLRGVYILGASTAQELWELLKRNGFGPFSPGMVKMRLARLEADKMIEHIYPTHRKGSRAGIGRPPRVFRATGAGARALRQVEAQRNKLMRRAK